MSTKSRKCGPKAFEKLTWKTNLKNMKNVFRISPKMRSKKRIFLRFFEVWRQRCSQGAPKGSPRHLPGSKLWEKTTKIDAKCHEKGAFFEVQLKAKCYRILFLRLARLGGKTYGGCLPDASEMPDASQMTLRCLWDASQSLPDAFQVSFRCLSDAFQMPLRCLSDILYPNTRICLGSRAGVI